MREGVSRPDHRSQKSGCLGISMWAARCRVGLNVGAQRCVGGTSKRFGGNIGIVTYSGLSNSAAVIRVEIAV